MRNYLKQALIVAVFSPLLVFGQTLWNFYQGDLPPVEERALVYTGAGFHDKYTGTAKQNTALLNFLLSQEPTFFSVGSLAPPSSQTTEATTTTGWTDDGTAVRLNTQSDSVGIGTTGPTQKLEVAGSILIQGANSLYLSDTAHQILASGGLIIRNNTASEDITINNLQARNILFYTNALDRGRFDSTGRFGIGTTSPFAKLSVHALDGETNTSVFAISSSTATATSSLFAVLNNGRVGVGSSSPITTFSVAGDGYFSNGLGIGTATTSQGNLRVQNFLEAGNASTTNLTVSGNCTGCSANLVYGSGTDGALALTSGTTTINVGGQRVFQLNYTSVSITSTGSLEFSNPNANGTVVIIKSQGACTLTSSGVAIYLKGLGAAGGAIGTAGRGATATNIGNRGNGPGGGLAGLSFGGATGHGGGGGGGGSGTVGTSGDSVASGLAFGGFGGNATTGLASTTLYAEAGGGGASGSDATETGGTSSAGGAGGIGGGGLVLTCGGAYNNTSIITTVGTVGTASANTTADGGGGGGGAGGNILVVYRSLTADSGTYNTTGGTGATGNAGGAGGAGGTGQVLRVRNFDLP